MKQPQVAKQPAHLAGGCGLSGSPAMRRPSSSSTTRAAPSPPLPGARQAVSDLYQREDEDQRAAIKDLLYNRNFSMAYQPIVDLFTGRALGFEALCRFDGEPERSPHAWFEEAKSVGLGIELELAAIAMAVEKIDQLAGQQYISINASPSTLIDQRLAELLAPLPLNLLLLEITEHEPIEDHEAIGKALAPLRQAGLSVAVDDAGAGHASLDHIIQVNPDVIKLDISLTRQAESGRGPDTLMGQVLSHARQTGSMIIAEGVETPQQVTALKRLGIRRGQGYWLGRPSEHAMANQDR